MTSAPEDGPRLAQFRAVLRLPGARRAFDVLVEGVLAMPGWRCLPLDDSAGSPASPDSPPTEVRCVHEESARHAFSLAGIGGDLRATLDGPAIARLPEGLWALEAGLGTDDAAQDGVWSLQITRPAQADTLLQLVFDAEGAQPRLKSRHWRLNVPAADAPQIQGGYVWAPRKPVGRGRLQVRPGVTLVLPGDVVFARASGRMVAIGMAMDRARGSPDPALTSSDGWLVPVRFELLRQPSTPSQSPPAVAQAAATRGRRRTAARSESSLAPMPDAEAGRLRRSLAPQVEAFEERITWETDGRLIEQAIEEQLWLRTDLTPSAKRQLSAARSGRGLFRDNVEQLESACRVTGVLDRRYLRATHIKPWREASDAERIDGANGLLLSPHASHLLRRGQISFADDGALLVSKHLNPYVLKAWNLRQPVPPRAFRAEQRVYLDYHRSHLFERIEAGRRTPAPDPQERR